MFSPNTDTTELETTIRNARAALLEERNEYGFWTGELSSSALSTATAIVALHLADPEEHAVLVQRGSLWLLAHQNTDGGWGDTICSFSNLPTTLLCWSALTLVRPAGAEAVDRAEKWIEEETLWLKPERIAECVKFRYGRDRTFAVPILMTCAICGTLGPDRKAWRRVLPLPLELAALPRAWFAVLRLPVVSYALPALIAIGYARNVHAPPPLWGRLRGWVWPRVSRLLTRIQPSSGGFLEAAPLTSFVTMALASSGQKDHPVVKRGVGFLQNGVRGDGSWPIDTNLATWVTTLSVKGLLNSRSDKTDFPPPVRRRLQGWLLDQQSDEVHPFTQAAPGAWAWTHLSGGVPDADDTAGALLALHKLREEEEPETVAAAERGCLWLLDLQNDDGGIPTFCHGWGTLPFDRSSPDLTAHALRAWNVWKDEVSNVVRARMDRAMERAMIYLDRTQDEDGSWTPLWFGNQYAEGETNRTYGTAMVLMALNEIAGWALDTEPLRVGAAEWLLLNQNGDGGWGEARDTPSSVEETALAIEALAGLEPVGGFDDRIYEGAAYLIRVTRMGTRFEPSPIGFYFAKLWYYERLYPLIWTVSALESL